MEEGASELMLKMEMTEGVEDNVESPENADKPSLDHVPPHMMGRTLEDPTKDSSGKSIPKPRLGVKVPYRNLTSQIVSQDEIAQEILERSLRKYSHSSVVEGGDLLFAMKLTHRLANKITTPDDEGNKKYENGGSKLPDLSSFGGSVLEVSSTSLQPLSETYQDTDALLAVLEDSQCQDPLEGTSLGMVSDVKIPSRGRPKKRTKEVLPKQILDPELEKELALRQLEDFEMLKKKRTRSGVSEAKKEKEFNNEPKRFPKKYQRVIRKQQQKAGSTGSGDSGMKLPEVPEVQIAIDRYIRTYTNKRKKAPETPVEVQPAENGPVVEGEREGEKEIENVETRSTRSVSKEVQKAEAVVEPTKKVEPKKNASMMREINRLLGDEGAINMIYSLQNPDAVSNPMRRKKKDLLLKTKLVKNQVLRSSIGECSRQVRKKSPAADTTSTKLVQIKKEERVRKVSVDSGDSDGPRSRKAAADASRIIRRHSSSSESDEEESYAEVQNGVANGEGESGKKVSPVEEKKSPGTHPTLEVNHEKHSVSPGKNGNVRYEDIAVTREDHIVQVTFTPTTAKMPNSMSIQTLRELTAVLTDLEMDEDCRIVLFVSSGSEFCSGVDLQTLYCCNVDERITIVDEFVEALREFLRRLSDFSKVLVAGVHGIAMGLGVTMLPYFDMVFASDTATFYAPYAKLGQIPEALGAMTLSRVFGNALAGDFFLGCRTLTANEALQYGLVSRNLWHVGFNEKLQSLVKSFVNVSNKSTIAIKAQMRVESRAEFGKHLDQHCEALADAWSGDEFQANAKLFLESHSNNNS